MVAVKRKVLLVDDHEIVRAGLSAVISAEADLEVVDQKADAHAGLQCIESLKPDVVVVDINMPGSSPFDMATAAQRSQPTLKVIFLTAFNTDSNLERALQCGAAGFVSKSESLTTIVEAIREVLDGKGPYFSTDVKQRVVTTPRFKGPLNADTQLFSARKSLLSPREQEILCCVAQGQSAKQIAQMLSISAKTVERHKSNIMTKLHLHTQVDLTRYAIREGMIAP